MDDHGDVDEEKEQESRGDEEVQRARGLPTAHTFTAAGKGGVEGGGQGEPGPDHQRKQNEDHEQVSSPLQNVVGTGFRWIGRRAAKRRA